ncbi:acetamidase/formamidase family protein [Ralstonia pickettii]|nr:acetamidase/formamidase family protein [Ralstonia pickettii]
MAIHKVELERQNLHGSFSREYEPILKIKSGDIVQYCTLDGDWLEGMITDPVVKQGKAIFERDPLHDAGHALCGPIEIEDAEPGMTLAIRINENRPGSWGWSRVGGNNPEHDKRLGVDNLNPLYLAWSLDLEKMVGKSHMGHEVPLNPFIGVFGMPPNEPGVHSTHPPRFCGGNIDCKELVPGSTLYLPITVPGALFSVGDGHAAQGDGELGGTAIECPMEKVELSFELIKDLEITMPRAFTPSGWITFGFHEDLHEAVYIALNEMAKFIQQMYGFEKREALSLTSQVVDMKITQVVNGVCGAHAVLPHGAIHA